MSECINTYWQEFSVFFLALLWHPIMLSSFPVLLLSASVTVTETQCSASAPTSSSPVVTVRNGSYNGIYNQLTTKISSLGFPMLRLVTNPMHVTAINHTTCASASLKG
jgi:hypothetical protein